MIRPLGPALLFLLTAVTASAAPLLEEAPREGYMAPTFSGITLEGPELSSKRLTGKAVLLNFWATWCPPCRDEIPELNRLAASLPATAAVVVGVSQDSSQGDLADFLAHTPVEYPVVLDADREIGKRFRARALPVTYLIDATGRIREHIVGPRDWSKPKWREKLLDAAK